MSKPKFIKPLLIGCACAVPVGLVVGLSVNWDHRQFISSVGSSGVKPFVESFGKKYIDANPKIDVQVESGGTTFAIEEVAKGLTNIGNASNNPYYTINPEKGSGYKDQWVNKKTFTLGYEGLVMLYKLPEGLSPQAKEKFDIVINSTNILDLYAVFSGFNETQDGETVHEWTEAEAKEKGSMLHYMTDEAKAAFVKDSKYDDEKVCANTTIIPFVRSGGNTAANSSIAFTYYSNLAEFEEMTINQQNAFKGGQYGSARLHYETEESNARAWEMFTKINQPGSMVYLTTGFVKNKANQEAIKSYGYQLAGYQRGTSDPVWLVEDGDLKKICTYDGYNWYRPINCMIDLNNKLSKDFITWIYKDYQKEDGLYQTIVKENGAKPLTQLQYQSMLGSDGTLFSADSSDIELLKNRVYPFNETYGAEDLWV